MTRYIYTAAYITVIVAANWATSTFGLGADRVPGWQSPPGLSSPVWR